ncbi:MAG TPA: M36 family metallopeptidase, partial [Tepidisphaeraceae bacterium]|nr:M36 family metallopeptidase [Tepidisphaeraceae bacterium]
MAGLFTPSITNLTKVGSFLTGPSNRAASNIASDYLMSQRFSMNTRGADWEDAFITNQYTDASNGLSYIYYRQEFNDRPVLNANANVAIDRNGRVLAAASSFVHSPASVNGGANRGATLSAKTVLTGLADELEVSSIGKISTKTLSDGTVQITAPNFSSKTINAKLVYVAQADGSMELSWHMIADLPSGEHWYELAASATTGEVVFASDYVDHATYLALPSNAASPYDGNQITMVDPQNPNASPFGWHDTNGVAGAEYTYTRGNNVYAYLDRDDNDSADTGSSGTSVAPPDGLAGLNFNFPADFTAAPTTNANQRAAAVNLFVQNNYIHDVTYAFGFTESAGNFQVNNY